MKLQISKAGIAEDDPVMPRAIARRHFSPIAGVAAVGAVALASVPFWADNDLIRIMGEMMVYLALASLWNLIASYGGLLSVGQQAFVGIGGYALFALTVPGGMPVLVALPLVGLIGLLAAIPIALLALRLRGAYFAIGTWAIAEVLRLGVMSVPALGGGSGSSLPSNVLRSLASTRDARNLMIYEVGFAIALTCMVLTVLLLRSRWGLALRALRDSEVGAESLGIRVGPIKLILFCLTAMMTSLVGAVVVMQKLRVSPDAQFSVTDWTAFVIFMVVIGGFGTVEGPIIGVVLFIILRELLSDLGTFYQIILGLIAIGMMLKARDGLWGAIIRRTGKTMIPIARPVPVSVGQ